MDGQDASNIRAQDGAPSERFDRWGPAASGGPCPKLRSSERGSERHLLVAALGLILSAVVHSADVQARALWCSFANFSDGLLVIRLGLTV